jgi:hypothetical protein
MERWPRQAFATLLVSSGGALALGMAPTVAMVAWDLPLINYSAGEASEYLSCCCHASEGKAWGAVSKHSTTREVEVRAVWCGTASSGWVGELPPG